jgi:hypothetical protein
MSFQGKKNIYKCEAAHITVTIDRDEGVTPFMIKCPECGEYARSKMYHPQCQFFDPKYEWYSPDTAERETLPASSLEHVERGGLLIRPL